MKKHIRRYTNILFTCMFVVFMFSMLHNEVFAQESGERRRRRGRVNRTPTLGLEQGLIELDTPDFHLKLVKASQTVAALEPKGANGFDFTPADLLESRASDGFYYLGDLTLRVRIGDSGQWQSLSTATSRKPVTTLETSGQTLASADLSPTLPDDCPLRIIRTWSLDNGRLV
ncbi:MAG: DUF5695 domain-containing protein, partial [Phycisphaerales bacterium]